MAKMSEVVVIVFARAERGPQAAEVIGQLDHEGIVDLHNLGVIVHEADGTTHIHERNDFSRGEGLALGAVLGGVAGLLTRKPIEGAALGAAGGYIASLVLDLGFDDATLRAIAGELTPDSSALVAALEIKDLAEVARRLAPYGGTIARDTLPDGQGAQLAALLKQSVAAS
jgi:uncharacterized membrane protein